MSFRITGLDPAPFAPLFALGDAELVEHDARRCIADAAIGFPCRVTLEDARIGEELLLVNHEHQPAPTPYRSRHAIFVRRDANTRFDRVNELPPAFSGRILALRAFDARHMIVAAELTPGADSAPVIERLLAMDETEYVQAHFAARGCFIARVTRA